ncbi:hypothetical protein ND856_19290, partial [Leptospira bandrabouensis]|uniref:hypothetical protein n=1 Tax=Leptospira bandrabouensis TaxID=2484903 RepID=UPI00223E7579
IELIILQGKTMDILNKLEDFLFDWLGLSVPGIVGFSLTLFPFLLIDPQKIIDSKSYASELIFINNSFEIFIKLSIYSKTTLAIFFMIFSYILGNIIKVTSGLSYSIISDILDERLLKAGNRIINFLKTCNFIRKILNFINNIFPIKVITKEIVNIFRFKSPKYSLSNKYLDFMKKKIQVDKSEELDWYDVYKYCLYEANYKKIRSFSGIFLAKYNFFKCLAFLCLLSSIYYYYFFQLYGKFVYDVVNVNYLFIFLFITFYSLHTKYKKYYTLCGNEAIIASFMFHNQNEK